MNRVELVGRLARDPQELRRSANGTASIRFTIAVDRRSKNEDKADFIPCVAFNKSAEVVELYFKKGMLVGVEGRLSTSDYEKDGRRVFVTEVTCDNVQILEPKGTRETAVRAEPSRPTYEPPVEEKTSIGIDINDDDLSFM